MADSEHTRRRYVQRIHRGHPDAASGEHHGARGTPEYSAWLNIKTRCFRGRPKHSAPKSVCPEWSRSFPAFLKDVGLRPGPEYRLELADKKNGRYYPGEVRWVKQRQVVVGDRFGILVVVSAPDGRTCFCRCDCGRQKEVVKYSLLRGASTSCQCRRDEINRKPLGVAAFNHVYSHYRRDAAARGREFLLTPEEFRDITSRPCIYCGLAWSNRRWKSTDGYRMNGEYKYNGVDRVDNSKGYVAGNVVPCCKMCNRAKGPMPAGLFEAWLDRIADHRKRNLSGPLFSVNVETTASRAFETNVLEAEDGKETYVHRYRHRTKQRRRRVNRDPAEVPNQKPPDPVPVDPRQVSRDAVGQA